MLPCKPSSLPLLTPAIYFLLASVIRAAFEIRLLPGGSSTVFYTIEGIPGTATSHTFEMPEWVPTGEYWMALTVDSSWDIAGYVDVSPQPFPPIMAVPKRRFPSDALLETLPAHSSKPLAVSVC